MRVLAALTALIVLQAGTAPAVQSPGDSPSAAGPTRTPQSVTVRIDVIAADAKGRVLDNLRPSDFALVDDGAVQTLEGVKFVRAASDDPRIVALFLDEYHVSAESTESVRTSLTRFVEQDLRAQDLLVVMKPLDSIFTIAPTTDRGPALEAIRAFEGRAGDFEARNAYERNFMAGTPARIEQARTQVALSAINAIAVHLASYADQRKTIVVVSEGFGRGERRRGLEFLPTVETIVRSAQQANASIYAVSPRAEAPEGDVLPGLSTETMGHATVADLDGGLRRALTDASGYYLLTYRTQRPDDGRFHAVQVTVKKPGTEVRARKGYYAPSPDAALRAAVLARINNPTPAPPPEPAPHASPLIRPWLGTTRGADGKTRVTFVWEPVVRLTGERNQQTPTRLVLTALDVHDAVLYEGVVLPTAPGLIEEPGAASRVVFDMPPGRLRLRMSIQDAAQRSLDTDVRSITIREMDKGVAIGTPEVLRARNAREFRALSSEASVPAASREFSRTERLLIRFNAYSSDDAALTVTARLLSRMGPMRDLPITRASDRREIDLPLAGLATGEYTVELTATGTSGEARDVVTFRVTT